MSVKALSVRFPEALYDRAAQTARRRGIKLNKLIQEAVARTVEEEEKKQLFDSFTLLGSDPEMSDVSYAFEAQSEVALHE